MVSTVTLRNNFFSNKEEMKMADTKVQMTNADRIRAMSDEELAELLDHELGCPITGDCEKMSRDCNACWLDWLQQPGKENDYETD